MADRAASWEPLSPDELVEVLRGLGCRWWLAGGWALDAHLGRQTRAHEDIDVLVMRPDQLAVQRHLAGWDLHAADPPGTLRPWLPGELLGPEVHDIWCRRTSSSSWSLQLMLGESEGADWVYRRDARIRRPVTQLDGPASNDLVRVLGPDVQLLHKSANPRPKDEADFAALADALGTAHRQWLKQSLATVSTGHPWLARL